MNASIKRAWGAIWRVGLLLVGILLFLLLRVLLGVSHEASRLSGEARFSDFGSPLAMADTPDDNKEPPDPIDAGGDSSEGDGPGDGGVY